MPERMKPVRSKQEIERKWLLSKVPDQKLLDVCHIDLIESHVVHQAYLYADDNIEVRLYVRYDGATYDTMQPHINRRRLTIKFGNGLVREEAEIDLTGEQMTKLMAHVKHPFIRKIFRIYRVYWGSDTLKFECSEVDPGTPDSFIYSEIEFESERDANSYRFPGYFEPFLIREVTGEKSWAMKNYWRRTRLGEEV